MNSTLFAWQHRNPLFMPWMVLLLLGWLMVTSASTGIADYYTGNAAYFSLRQGVYIIAGILVLYGVSCISLQRWASFDVIFLVISVVALVMVFLPVIGHEVNGSRRWLNLGIIKVQASEIAKLAAVFYVAGYLVRRQEEVKNSWSGFIKPIGILSFVVVLLLLEPDFGAVVVLMGAILIQLFLGGVKAGQFFLVLIVTLIISVIALVSESYRLERLLAYLDPWAPEHVYGTGYQLTQSLIAFGRGEWFGIGLGESVQKLFYLPEAHTDFVFAIWAEETGLIGALIALAILSWLLAQIWITAWRAQQRGNLYAAYIAIGIASLFGLQILINIGVNIGLLPTKGLTLPFFSYGGSSLLICCAMVGIVLRIAYETSDTQSAEVEHAV